MSISDKWSWPPVVSPCYVLAASVGLVIAGYAVRAWRWQLMLRGAGVNATYRQAAPIFFASFALNNVLPLRAGDLYRCVSTLSCRRARWPNRWARY